MSAARALALACIGVGVLAGAVFLAAPEIDLSVSRLLWRPDKGFLLSGIEWPRVVTRGVQLGSYVAFVALAVLLGLRWVSPRLREQVSAATLVYLMASLAIGPGLVTNELLKDQFGRARPSQIAEFGGTKRFTPPLVLSDQCERNCSFVAGDPSIGFTLIAAALAFPVARRRLMAAGLAVGFALGFMRMAQGAHFLSDVIFSFVANGLVFALLYALILARSKLS